MLSFSGNCVGTPDATRNPEEPIPPDIRSNSSHVFTIHETTNLQIFSRIFLCFAFLQESSFVLISKMPIQLFIRYLSRFFDCLVNQNLSSTLATDQK